MNRVGPIQIEFMQRAMQILKRCDSKNDFETALCNVFREALDTIKHFETRDAEFIADVRILTTAMRNCLGLKDGEHEEVEDGDGVCMILTEHETKKRFVDTCVAMLERVDGHTPSASIDGKEGDGIS